MTNKAILPLLIVVTAVPQAGMLAAEPLPPRALARIGDHRFYHGPGIGCAVLSPDGKRVASAARYSGNRHISDDEREAYNPLIVLWDAASGERLRELLVPHGSAWELAFSPDSKRLAAVYDISTVFGIAPFAEEEFGVVVFEVETGKLLWQRGNFKSRVNYLQFSADGKELRVDEWAGPISGWDPATGKQLLLCKPPAEIPPEGSKDGVCGVRGVLSPDGKVIVWEMWFFKAAGLSKRVAGLRFQYANNDKLLYQKKLEPDDDLGWITFSANGKRFAANYGDKLRVWETATGKELVALKVPDMRSFALAPDGRHAVIHEDDSGLRLWDLTTGKPTRNLCPRFVPLQDHLLETSQVFSCDGKTVLVGTDSTLRFFDTVTGKERGLPGHRAPITPQFSADGRTLFTACDERRCRWDVSGKSPTLLKHEPRNVWEINCLAQSADERFFLDDSEHRVRIRETTTGRVLCTWDKDARFGRFSPDATRVLLLYREASDKDVFCLYDAKTGKALSDIKPVKLAGFPAFSPNGRLFAWVDETRAVHLHDVSTGKADRTLRSVRPPPITDHTPDLLFSPDSEYIVEGQSPSSIRVFHITSGREIARFSAAPEKTSKSVRLSCLACSPDGRVLAVTEEYSGIVRLLEIASGKVRVEFAGHRHGVHGLAFSPNGQTLASGGEDNVVFLWDVTGARTPPVAEKPLPASWADLASEDAKRAGDAIAGVLRKPDASVAFLKERLRPAEAPDEKRLTRLLAALDSDAFETREAANRELARLGDGAEASLRRALNNRPSLEMKRRIEDLLNKLEPSPLPPETLRTLRAIEVLEHLGTAEARGCLDALAKGAPQARLTREAKKALDRLANRR